MQAEFAQAIAKQVKVELTPEEVERFENIREVNPEAHEAYLKGRFFNSKGRKEDVSSNKVKHS